MRALVAAIIFSLISTSAFAEFGRSTSFDDREVCQKDKGVWREFGNSAADNCEPKMDRFSIAAQALTYACDCGKNRCWNGEHCVLIEDYKKIYDQKYAEERKKIAQERKKRESEYRDYSNNRLRQMITQMSPQNGQNPDPNSNVGQFSDKFNSAAPVPTNQQQIVISDMGSQPQGMAKLFTLPNHNAPTNSAQNNPTQANPTQTNSTQTNPTQAVADPVIPQITDITAQAAAQNQVAAQNNTNVQSNNPDAGPTPFFLKQQEKAKSQAAANSATATTTTQNNSDIGLPQIPLPQ